MVYVRSRKFCCCLPVRFGVFVIAILGIIGGGLVSLAGWLQIKQLSAFPSPEIWKFRNRLYFIDSSASARSPGRGCIVDSNSHIHPVGDPIIFRVSGIRCD
jgi:hypothetical protein